MEFEFSDEFVEDASFNSNLLVPQMQKKAETDRKHEKYISHRLTWFCDNTSFHIHPELEVPCNKTQFLNTTVSTQTDDGLLLHVFSFLKAKYLTNAAIVCKRWKSLHEHELLWKNLSMKIETSVDYGGTYLNTEYISKNLDSDLIFGFNKKNKSLEREPTWKEVCVLLSCLCKRKLEWYKRSNLIKILSRKMSIEVIRAVVKILNFESTAEVRMEIWKMIADGNAVEFKDLLLKIYQQESHSYDRTSIAESLGTMGATEIFNDLLEVSFSAWAAKNASERRVTPGFAALVNKMGVDAAVDFIFKGERENKTTPEKMAEIVRDSSYLSCQRSWIVFQLFTRKEFQLLSSLVNEKDKVVIQTLSRGTRELMKSGSHQEFANLLIAIRDDKNRSPYERLLSAYLLLDVDIETPEAVLRSIETFPYPLPPFIAEDLRKAIVAEYGLYSERGSDIRWKLEASCYQTIESVPNPLLEKVKELLQVPGWPIRGPLPCDKVFPGGSGTFDVLTIPLQSNDSECLDIYFSRLGPFAKTSVSHQSKSTKNPLAPSLAKARECVENALNEIGIQLLDQTILDFVVPELCVYFFGSRNPLPIKDLLFYWQD